ncbi:hypothetical protein JW859_01705 [bacterium]|nr:hypothetical protein [bacterium]
MKQGLGWQAARRLGLEEVLCLLYHAALSDELAALEGEAARVASLSFADPAEQQRALAMLGHRRQAALDRFYRPRPLEETTGGRGLKEKNDEDE